jgi:hypothetical protein
MELHFCNLSPQEAEARVQGQPGLHKETLFQEKKNECSKTLLFPLATVPLLAHTASDKAPAFI